ncbi:MAG: D-aminoacyl-tRNA deacylase, partial [Verrucomicrobiota bacterium]|nr:D-aminoacyl-tRNA deacylase [Verrucomicrobiota bacterium]
MRAVIQRVSRASVTIEEEVASSIDSGLLVLLGIEEADDNTDIEWLTAKIANMRILDDG